MSPTIILRIIVVFQSLICFSSLIFSDFYIVEISKKYEAEPTTIVVHMYYLLVALSFALTNLTLFGSLTNNKEARMTLLGVAIGSTFILITLLGFFFATPFRPPAFILFLLLCISVLSFIFCQKTKYDFLD
jgi:hypothetical protein